MASHLSGIFWFCSPFREFRGINSRYLLDYKGEAYFTHYSVIVRSPAKQVSNFPSHFSAQTCMTLLKRGQGLNYSGQNLARLGNRRRKFSHSRTGSDFNPSGLAKGYRSSRGRKTNSKITINTHCKTIYTEVTPLVMASRWNLKAKIHILWRKTYWFDLIHIFRSKASAHVPWPESLIYLFHFFFQKWTRHVGDFKRTFSRQGGSFSCIGDRISRNFEPYHVYFPFLTFL